MTDEIDVLKKAIAEHDKALRLKNINVELHSHLTGSIYWLLKYSEKHNVSLPKKDELIRMLDKSDVLIDSIISKSKEEKYQPNVNTNNNSREDNSTTVSVLLPSWDRNLLVTSRDILIIFEA